MPWDLARYTPIDMADRSQAFGGDPAAVDEGAMVARFIRSPRLAQLATLPPYNDVRLRWDANLAPLSDWQIGMGGLVLGMGTPYCLVSWEGFGLPDVRANDVGYPSQHGVIALGDFHEGRTFTFVLQIDTHSCSSPRPGWPAAGEAWDLIRDLAGAWQAAIVDQPLTLGIPGFGTLATPGRPRRMEVDNERLRRGQASIALEFLATDPRLYSIDVSEQTIAMSPDADPGGSCLSDPNGWCLDPAADPDGCLLDLQFPQVEGSGVADNQGNATTPPVLVFHGPAVDPALLNLTTSQIMDFEGTTLLAGDVLEVDHHARRVVLNGTPRYDLLAPGSTFWRLVPGRNDLRYAAAAPEGSVTVRYRTAWL